MAKHHGATPPRTRLEDWIEACEGIERLTRAALEDLQLRRLNDLLARERQRGGFYGNLPARLSSLADLAALPFTFPEDVVRHAPEMTLRPLSQIARAISETSSGTTGLTKRLLYSERDLANTAGFFAAGLSELVRPEEPVAIAMPRSARGGLCDLIAEALRRLGARPFMLGTDLPLDEAARQLACERAAAYVGMPVPLLGTLRYAASAGVPLALERALVSGDACAPGVLSAIERRLGTLLFPHYGLRETALGCAVTCPAHEGMHVRENHVIVEVVDDEGRSVPDGEPGELTLTTVGLDAMPLVRYRTGDRACILPKPCPCGGVTKRIDSIARIGDGVSMGDLDEAVFSASEHVLDCRAQCVRGLLRLLLRTDGMPCAPAVLAAVHDLCPTLSVVCEEETFHAGMPPFYRAKRTVLKPRDGECPLCP